MIAGEATADQCQEVFEKIIEQHNYHNGNHDYLNYVAHLKAYRDLLRKFNTVRASLLYLFGPNDKPIIQYLSTQGYKIDDSCNSKFQLTLAAAIAKSNNLNSKLKQKYNQIMNFNVALIAQQQEYNSQTTSLEECLAALSFNLGFSIDEDVKLARYNAYVKEIHKQNKDVARTKRHNLG